MAVDGDTAVVGADGHDTARGEGVGSAYVFVRSGTAWAQQAELTASDGTVFDFFGSVALKGDTVAVGASGDDTPLGVDAGSAYVFVRSGTIWTQRAKLTASDGTRADRFGEAVALSGRTAVVGAVFAGDEVDAGATYVFVRSGMAWTQRAKITAPDGNAFDFFGASVAVSGDTALIGARGHETTAGSPAGSAYLLGLG